MTVPYATNAEWNVDELSCGSCLAQQFKYTTRRKGITGQFQLNFAICRSDFDLSTDRSFADLQIYCTSKIGTLSAYAHTRIQYVLPFELKLRRTIQLMQQ